MKLLTKKEKETSTAFRKYLSSYDFWRVEDPEFVSEDKIEKLFKKHGAIPYIIPYRIYCHACDRLKIECLSQDSKLDLGATIEHKKILSDLKYALPIFINQNVVCADMGDIMDEVFNEIINKVAHKLKEYHKHFE